MSTEVTVDRIPTCDFCDEPAKYDGRTRMGPWAMMCGKHFVKWGVGLGTGKGQELFLATPKAKPPKRQKQPSISTLMRWEAGGTMQATDGCRVEPDGRCPHGCPSWLVALGLI